MSKGKTIVLTVIGILLLLSLMIGISYSLWRVNLFQTTANTLVTDCFNITFTEENNIELLNAYPMYDEDGSKLTPYTFTIKNNCASYATYEVRLEVLNTSTLNDQYVKVMLDENGSKILTNYNEGEITLENAKASYILDNNSLDKNEEKTYNLRVWLDENVTLETEGVQNSNWNAKVTITAKYSDHLLNNYELCVEKYGEDSVNCNIIAQLDDTGACPTVNDDGTVRLTSAEPTNEYICSAPDDYGMSYYFRGTPENNWVKFAGYYWRILRINGDDSIRMIYAGDASVIDALDNKEEVLKNGYDDSTTKYTQIGESFFNSSYNDNAYVGYMYGIPGSTTYEETHANINNSTIKETVDEWYENHIKNTEYEQYISDTLFCNDRSFAASNTGTGVGNSFTRYRGNSYLDYVFLTCTQQNDRFTVDDAIIGNGDLTYPIGLINLDEIYLAGGYASHINRNYYLYNGSYYWTLSPSSFSSNAFVRYMGFDGIVYGSANVTNSRGVRPVINLKPNSLNTGDGTASNPYQIQFSA